jgi:spore germination protein GerM
VLRIQFRRRWSFRSIGIILMIIAGWVLWIPAARLPAAAVDQQTAVNLYFMSADEPVLMSEERMIRQGADPTDFGRAIIEALIEGPKSKLIRTLPEKTLLRGFYLSEDATAVVDFTDSIRKHHPGGCRMELLTIYSIVNSLALNMDRIRTVKLLIDGQEAQTLAGHIDIQFPLSPNMLIIR